MILVEELVHEGLLGNCFGVLTISSCTGCFMVTCKQWQVCEITPSP